MSISSTINSNLKYIENQSKNITYKLDQISRDIKKIEQTLQKSNFGFEHQFDFRDDKPNFAERKIFKSLRTNYSISESLVWGRSDANNKFRILYKRTMFVCMPKDEKNDGLKTVYKSCNCPDGVTLIKPLIETNINVRIDIQKYLLEFLKQLQNKLS